MASLLLAQQVLAQMLPALTGRVVDGANLLSADKRTLIEAKLKAHEEKTTDQVVVATVPSLGGAAIEDYANRLYRDWKLGTLARNNGALLLVAPNERKVRIEVGYGLEGALTDALTGVIIRTAIAPKFKAGDFPGGIEAGVDAVLDILSGDAEQWQRRAPTVRSDAVPIDPGMMMVILVAGFILMVFLVGRAAQASAAGGRPHRRRNGSWVVIPSGGGWSGGGWSGGGGSDGSGGGGGFSGGGGSSGGGGASGSW